MKDKELAPSETPQEEAEKFLDAFDRFEEQLATNPELAQHFDEIQRSLDPHFESEKEGKT